MPSADAILATQRVKFWAVSHDRQHLIVLMSNIFDGNNFYRSMELLQEGLELDYDRLVSWVVAQVGGANASGGWLKIFFGGA